MLKQTLLLLISSALLSAADPFYFGTWKVASAAVAPWWQEKGPPDAKESKTLVGKTFQIGSKAITGPRQVACKNPQFEVKLTPADFLFEGMLENIRDQPKALASMGFTGKQWRTVITGCANELEFHFMNDVTAAIGLNNYIYTLRKQ
jgi:hypothetical protein